MDVLIIVLLVAECAWVTPFKLASPVPACPSRNSCQHRNVSDSSAEPQDPCYCDALCNTYADCCLDAEYRDASQQKIDVHDDFWCHSLGSETFSSYLKQAKCKEGWTDKEVEDLCLRDGVYSDPLSGLLVTSKTTGFTYQNYYCAICNEDVLDLRMWNGKLSCSVPTFAKVNLNDLVFKDNTWGVFYGSPEEEDFRSCSLEPERPQDIKNLTRTCPLSFLIRTCPDDWQDEAVASQCQSYTAVVYYDREAYRNPHCALCNYKPDNYSCDGWYPDLNFTVYESNLDDGGFGGGSPGVRLRPVSFAQIFDFTDPSSNLVGSSAPCSPTQVWDPFFKQCRSIVCPEPHQDYRYEKCEDVGDVNSTSNDTDSTEAPLSTNFTLEFIECYKVVLAEGDFVFLDNGSVYVAEYDRYYSPGEYAGSGEGDLLVCLPDASTSRKFSAVLGWVSLAGLSLSCTGLLLHLAVFALLPELRNLSGKNLASLCLALLAAYVTFLVNTLMQPGPAGCLTLAAAMYYFFVTSFTWMNTIAFDVWYTIYLTQRQLRVSSGDQWQRFIAYSLYSWLLPAAATMALLLVDQLEPSGVPEEFLPRLGRTWCWFSHRKALLAFFAAPMVTIIVVNCVLFVSTASIITHTGSTAAATSARGGYHQGHYRVYLRLAVLMGFTWVSGIAAGYLYLEALWYIFVLLNTLQGVFIFLAFTVRTRVWQGVATATRKLLQRGLSRVTHRPPPPDDHAFELSQTPEQTSPSTPSTSLGDQ